MKSVSSVVETSPPRTTTAIGCTISRPAIRPAIASGANMSAVVTTEVRTGVNRSPAPRTTSSSAEGLTLVPLEMLSMPDLHDGLTGGEPEDREEPGDRSDRDGPAVDQHGDRTTGEAEGQHQEDERRQAPVADGCLHQQEDGERCGDREAQRLPIRGPAGRVVPDEGRVVFHRELDLAQSLPARRR